MEESARSLFRVLTGGFKANKRARYLSRPLSICFKLKSLSHGEGSMKPNRPFASSFGPAVKKSVSVG